MKLNIPDGHWPPGGWQYFDPKTGYREMKPVERGKMEVANAILAMRRNNRAQYPSNTWTLESCVQELELFTARRLLNKGLKQFVLTDAQVAQASVPVSQSLDKKKLQPESAEGAKHAESVRNWRSKLKNMVRGASTLADWVGSGQRPVLKELAERRALVCAGCPLNEKGDSVTGALAEAILRHTELKNKSELHTSYDEKLQSCSACDCHLPLKVWVPIRTILGRTDSETLGKLHKSCWILGESPGRKNIKLANSSRSNKSIGDIAIRRKGAIGDVVMATAIAKKVSSVAQRVTFQTVTGCRELIEDLPYIHSAIVSTSGFPHADIDLDHAYEKLSNLDRSRNPIPKLMMDCAVKSLSANGIVLEHPYANLTPELFLKDSEKEEALKLIWHLKKPWIAVIPKSNSWPCRTVSPESWEQFAGYFNGVTSPIWTGTDKPPYGLFDPKIRDLRMLAAMFSHCDLVVSVDTGPVHLAAAVGTPIVHITQSVAGIMTLPDQRDWIDYRMPLDCLACHAWKCPISEKSPPCQNVPGAELASFADTRLSVRELEQVSAILVTYRPDVGRINKAIQHVLPCVHEIIVAMDGDTSSDGITKGNKIKFVRHFSGQRRGFGKTFNLGARHSSCKYLLSLNDDVFVSEDCVDVLKSSLSSNPKAAVIGALLRYPNGAIQHGGTRRGGEGYGHIDHNQLSPSIKTLTEMECITFALAMFRRKAFYEVQGFDERYDCYSEDPDFCLRARQRGWSVLYEPRATAVHIEAQTTGKMNRNKLLNDGHAIFKSIWGWYFELNKHNAGLGKFA